MLLCENLNLTVEQNEARQVEMAKQQNADRIFMDKSSGRTMNNRTQLKEMLSFVREGDTVIVESISRLARNTVDFLKIIDELQTKKVSFVSLKEQLDSSTPHGKFALTIFGALYSLQLDNLRQIQSEGISLAKARGVYKGRSPKKIDEEKFKAMCYEWRQGKRTATSIIKAFDIAASTFYDWVKIRNL